MQARAGITSPAGATTTTTTAHDMKHHHQQASTTTILSLALLLLRLLRSTSWPASASGPSTSASQAHTRPRSASGAPRPRPPSPRSSISTAFGGDAKWTWALNLPQLSRDFHVYAPDLCFFVSASRSRSPLRSVAFQARCAADATRILGVPRYDVVGISYGGFVAYRLAAVEARGSVGRVVVMTTGVAATVEEMRVMAAREERAVEDALLPDTADGLRRLVRRFMHRPPPWMTDFVLHDFIQEHHIDRGLAARNITLTVQLNLCNPRLPS